MIGMNEMMYVRELHSKTCELLCKFRQDRKLKLLFVNSIEKKMQRIEGQIRAVKCHFTRTRIV